MKILKYLFLIIITFISFQCTSNPSKSNDNCKESEINNEKSARYLYYYQLNKEESNLDSALLYIEKSLGSCPKYNTLLSMRKLSILSIQHNYKESLLFINTLDSIILDGIPYYKSLLKIRFLAMQSQADGNLKKRNEYLTVGIGLINNFLNENKTKADSIFALADISTILKNPISFAQNQYYYYKSILEGKDAIFKELDKLKYEKNVNKDYIEYLKPNTEDNFMEFNGM